MTRVATAFLLLALGCLPAAAEKLPDVIEDLRGEWLVATDDGKPGCRIALEGSRTIGGYRATPAPDCASRIPRMAGATAWDFGEGGLRLRDATRKLLFDFQEDETTMMKTSWQTPPVAMIVRAKPGVERAPFAPDLVGTWAMRRPGGAPLCEVTMARTVPKSGDPELSLKTGTPCDPVVARLKLTTWSVEDFALMFYGENDTSLRFEPTADGYTKAEGGKPLVLVRIR